VLPPQIGDGSIPCRILVTKYRDMFAKPSVILRNGMDACCVSVEEPDRPLLSEREAKPIFDKTSFACKDLARQDTMSGMWAEFSP
jgi:hypothetical protein